MKWKKCVLQENVEYGTIGGGLFVKVKLLDRKILGNILILINIYYILIINNIRDGKVMDGQVIEEDR